MGKRIVYFDMLRGVAIIFVLFCHSYSGNPLGGGLKEELYLVIRQIVTCAVPIFLAESGFFLANRELNGAKEYFSFLGTHAFRIWLPMVLWSMPLFFIQEHNNYILSLLYMLLGGYSIYYFIILIIQFYALQPVLRSVRTGGGVIIALIINLLFVILDNYYISLQGNRLPLLFECGPFIMWIVYPVIGYYIGNKGRNYRVMPWLVLMIICLFCSVIESKWLYGFHKEGLGVTKVSSLLFSSCSIIVLFSERVQRQICSDSFFSRVLVYVGEISFGIYLIHKYVLDYLVVRIITDSIIRTVLTLSLSVAIIAFLKMILPTFLSRCLGLK